MNTTLGGCVRRALMLGVLTAFAATACGQRGPLYLPDPPPTSTQPAAAEQDAAAEKENGETPKEESDEETPGA